MRTPLGVSEYVVWVLLIGVPALLMLLVGFCIPHF